MAGVEMIASRAASRRAILVAFAGIAVAAFLVNRIAAAATESSAGQVRPRELPRNRTPIVTRFDDRGQTRHEVDARERLSFPPYLPLE